MYRVKVHVVGIFGAIRVIHVWTCCTESIWKATVGVCAITIVHEDMKHGHKFNM